MASTILLQSTQGFVDFTGDPVRADGWYGYPDSLYTIAISTQNFIGRIFIEASLALDPQDTITQNDWFALPLNDLTAYIDYPVIPSAPTGLNGGDTGTVGFTFRGNYLYLRAKVLRSQIYPNQLSPEQIELLGTARIVLSQSQTTYSSATTLPPVSGFTQLTNSGAGYQIYAGQNSAGIPVFRSLLAGDGIAISQTATNLTISALGTGSGSSSDSDPGSNAGTTFASGDTFITLNDTPASYVGFANSILQVNTAETGVIFGQLPALANSGNLADATGLLTVTQGGTGLATLTPYGLLVADSTGLLLESIPAPTLPNSVLSWNGNAFTWIDGSTIVSGSGSNSNQSDPVLNFTLDLGGYVSQPSVVSLLGDIGVITLADLIAGGVAPFYSNIAKMTTGNNLTLTGTEQYVIVNKTVGSITAITLPSNPYSGTTLTIKDGKGDANINNITILGNGKQIDGLYSIVITVPYQFYKLIFDGINWNIV